MDQNKIRRMLKQVEDAMAAVTFAEEGLAAEASAVLNRERRVLLALKAGWMDARTLRYAMNAALRIRAGLDILIVAAPGSAVGSEPQLESFYADLKTAGVSYQTAERSGCMQQEIIDYTNSRHGVLFVVVESPGSLNADCGKKDGMLSELWKNLRCPLVVVSEAGA